jgi:uncharacterized membrane protein
MEQDIQPVVDRSGTERVAAFSDGVIAIVITIMVLELKLPEHLTDHSIWSGILQPMSSKLVAYVMSFIVVAVMWGNHHDLLRTSKSATGGLIWANNHLLFWMSLIPFTTHLLGAGIYYPSHVAVYGVVLFATSLGFTLLRWVVGQQAGASTGSAASALTGELRTVMQRSLAGTMLYAAAIPLAYGSVWIAFAIFFFVPAMFYLPGLVRGQRGSR